MDEGQDFQQVLYMLYFLGVGLQIMPAQIGTNLMSHFYSLLNIGNTAIMIPTYLILETFMAAKKLSADFVEHTLKYLLENVPSGDQTKDNNVVYIAYMQSLVQTILNLSKSDYADSAVRPAARYFPAFVINMSELLVSPSVRVSRSAYNSLQSVFNSCLTPDFFSKKAIASLGIEELGLMETGEEKDASVSYLAQSVANLKYLLTPRFSLLAPDVYKLIGLFASKLRSGLVAELPNIVPLLTENIE